MTLLDSTAWSAAEKQNLEMNTSGSGYRKIATFSPPADTAWCVVGCVLAAAVEKTDEATLIANIESLSQVTSVHDPRVWLDAPASIEDAAKELRLHVNANESGNQGFGGDVWGYSRKFSENILLTSYLGKAMFVLALRVPADLDAAAITALETAITGVTGILSTEHLVGGLVPANSSSVSLSVEIRFRIDDIST